MSRPQFASNDISSITTGQISAKVDRIVPLEEIKIISQKCFMGDRLWKLLKWFRSAE